MWNHTEKTDLSNSQNKYPQSAYSIIHSQLKILRNPAFLQSMRPDQRSQPALLHRITETNGYAAICLGFEIVCNAERRTDFILTAISLTDIASVVKFAVVLLAQLGIDLLCTLVELLGQRQDADFNRCQSRMEMSSTDISTLQLFLVISSA